MNKPFPQLLYLVVIDIISKTNKIENVYASI